MCLFCKANYVYVPLWIKCGSNASPIRFILPSSPTSLLSVMCWIIETVKRGVHFASRDGLYKWEEQQLSYKGTHPEEAVCISALQRQPELTEYIRKHLADLNQLLQFLRLIYFVHTCCYKDYGFTAADTFAVLITCHFPTYAWTR